MFFHAKRALKKEQLQIKLAPLLPRDGLRKLRFHLFIRLLLCLLQRALKVPQHYRGIQPLVALRQAVQMQLVRPAAVLKRQAVFLEAGVSEVHGTQARSPCLLQ